MNKNILSSRSPLLAFALALALASSSALLSGCLVETETQSDPWSAAQGESLGVAEQALTTLTLVDEEKIDNLINAGTSVLEASGVQVKGGYLYIVFDNMSKIGKISTSLASGTTIGGNLNKSDFEGITYDDHNTAHFYVMKEMENSKGKVFQLDANANYESEEWTDVTFADSGKGFEGVAWMRRNNDDYLLGLCEGNNCKDEPENIGKGKIKILQQSGGMWVTVATLSVPSAANFEDYSDIALRPNADGTYKVAITSQASSKLWIGQLSAASWSFSGAGTVYDFPKAGGVVQYCTIEGVTFLSATQIAAVSDEASSASCTNKDQSVHIFNIP